MPDQMVPQVIQAHQVQGRLPEIRVMQGVRVLRVLRVTPVRPVLVQLREVRATPALLETPAAQPPRHHFQMLQQTSPIELRFPTQSVQAQKMANLL